VTCRKDEYFNIATLKPASKSLR